jgi:hypothetical protein
VFHNNESPEARYNTEAPCPVESTKSLPKRKATVGIVFGVLCIAVIGIGVGLGVGLVKPGNLIHTSNGSLSATATTIATSAGTTATPAGSSPTSASTPKIMNDTSFAVIQTSDDNKHLFFQTPNGSIQHMSNKNGWSIQDRLSISDAQNNTPLGANVPGDGFVSPG